MPFSSASASRPLVFAVVSRIAGGDVAARRLGVRVGRGRAEDLLAKVATWPAEADKRGRTSQARIASIAEESPRPLG